MHNVGDLMLNDDRIHYGSISRGLHWVIAFLLLWQFGGMLLKDVIGKGPLMAFWVGGHASVGVFAFALILVRVIWSLKQRHRRPTYGEGFLAACAKLGHLTMYALMVIVPSLAILRMLGNGRAISLFGIEWRAATGEKIAWMVEPANLAHGLLAWVLLALIAGHVAMVFVHRYILGDDVLIRMTGRRSSIAQR